MNWLDRIKQILGRFWIDLFEDSDFILAVEFLLGLFHKTLGYRYSNWCNGHIANNKEVFQQTLPFVVLIEVSDVRRESTALWTLFSAGEWKEEDQHGGWVATVDKDIPQSYMLVDHIQKPTVVLCEGTDYSYADGKFLFYTNPEQRGIPLVKVTDSNGDLHVYYRLFGYRGDTTKLCDPVTGFIASNLNDCADVAWDIHQNGATPYNVKKLLGFACDSVVSDTEGSVTAIWKEGNWNCIEAGGKVYLSKELPAVKLCDPVQKGTVLFGSMVAYSGNDDPAVTDIPGIRVNTDVGELYAYNSGSANDAGYLRLTGDTTAYKALCRANIDEAGCTPIEIPGNITPYKFITKNLRKGRCMQIRMTTADVEKLASVLKCIRYSVCESGIVNIYVQAAEDVDSTEDVIHLSCFEASVGMAAVAVDATVTIQEQCAEAEVLL